MTPPRDPDADSEFAPVIPLRRRQPDADASAQVELADPGSGGVWDTDAPPAWLTPRPSVWDQQAATELLVSAAAATREVDAGGHEDATAAAPAKAGSGRLRRRRLAQVATAIGALATTAVVIVLSSGAAHPHLTHTATRPRTSVSRRTVTHTPTASSATKATTVVHRAATTTAARKHTVARHRWTKHERRTHHAHHVTVITHQHVPSTGTPSSAPTPAATEPPVTEPTVTEPAVREPQITSVRSNQAPAAGVAPARGGAASSCVPGELGC
jgi:hypothetical protein